MERKRTEEVQAMASCDKGTRVERVFVCEWREDGIYSGYVYRVRCGVSGQCIGIYPTGRRAYEKANKYDGGWL